MQNLCAKYSSVEVSIGRRPDRPSCKVWHVDTQNFSDVCTMQGKRYGCMHLIDVMVFHFQHSMGMMTEAE